ncbi:MAG: NADH-quinone oxidoreductase subunit F [Planctomycetota bacterium]|jgi:NADH-quinone oxidoreductase subunit F
MIPAGETYLLNRIDNENSHTLAGYREHGGYQAIEKIVKEEAPFDQVIEVIKDSGLRGRGGAGFPTGLKFSFMPDPVKDPRPRYLAVNADESEPGTCKDRILMREDPHGLIEGVLIGCRAIRAGAAYIYVRGEYRTEYNRVFAAIAEAREAGLIGKNILGSDWNCEIFLHKGAGAYICGEETGLMESLEGKRGHPRPKPPFPAGFGLWGQPTTVSNVETLFNLPFILNKGAAWYRTMGSEASPGNVLCGISGHVERPGVYEVPLGIPARTVLEEYAGGVWKGRKLKAFYPGGSSTGLLPASSIDVAMDHDGLKNAGSMLGTAAIMILDETACTVRSMEVISRFYDHESCGQCSQCREGTQWLSQIFKRLENGDGKVEDVELLESLANGMAPGKTICALADAAAIPTHAIVRHFKDELMEHATLGYCPLKHDHSKNDQREPAEAGA